MSVIRGRIDRNQPQRVRYNLEFRPESPRDFDRELTRWLKRAHAPAG